MSRQQSINAKCKECIYDANDVGTWRQQVQACELTDCALYAYRPKSSAKPHRSPVEGDLRG